MHSQNKIGPHHQIMGQSTHTQKSFLFRSIDLYNKLPKNLTLIKSFSIFKKWIKMFNIDNKIKLPERQDNTAEKERFLIDYDLIQKCENIDN